MALDPARAKTLFLNAAEIADPAQRAAFLDCECGGDAELRARVEAPLAADDTGLNRPDGTYVSTIKATSEESPVRRDGTFVSTDPDAGDATAADEPNAHPPSELATVQCQPDSANAADSTFAGTSPDDRITRSVGGQVIAGRYTLLDVIGEGGMGSVYRTSQSTPVKRQVAMKLIKTGMNSRDVLARFDAERQALALMDHPNIARIYDGGVTEAGQPFFVMELVDGVPLTEYCDLKRLTVKDRLELFVAVCQAVQHAHQKGIIHRDLKPSNVIVTEVDGRPTPKVIDFGVAKATEQKLTDMSFADTGAIVGTPAYMSPEQADPSSMDIDTRTDVYALGVMLYELLVGSPPLDARDFKRGAHLEMLRMVREVDPPRPSTKLSGSDTLRNIAANRSIEPARLSKLLQGELDWVVMKALDKDRNRRYDTANGLARDLQRYLADEVVEARPPSTGYRLKKFVRRHKGQVIAASLILFSLIAASIVVAVVQRSANVRLAEANRQITTQRDEADRQRDIANKAKKQAEQSEATARKQALLALNSTQFILTEVDTKLSTQPGTAELRISLLKELEKRWDELDVAMAGGVQGGAIPTLMEVRYQMAGAWVSLDRLAEADAQYRKIFDQAEELISIYRTDSSRYNLAMICNTWAPVKSRLTGNPADAASLRHRAIELLREIRRDPRPGRSSPDKYDIFESLQSALIGEASAAVKAGDRAKAETVYSEIGELGETILREANAGAEWYAKLKPDKQQALKNYFAQNLELSRAGRANNLCALGQADAAIAIYEGIIERSRLALAKTPKDRNASDQLELQLRNFGQHMLRSRRIDDAANLLTESLQLTETNLMEDPTNARMRKSHAYALYYAGVAIDAQGKTAEALGLFERARKIRGGRFATSPDKSNKVDLMLVEGRLGNVDRAKALAEELSPSNNKDPDLRLDVARAMAQLSRHVEGATRDEFREAALDALARCLDEGQKDKFLIDGEQDLTPLKDDPRYREILKRLSTAVLQK